MSCTQAREPLDLESQVPSGDQRQIARYYSREAASFRQKAAELRHRADAYERLFGPDSEWVVGARLLAQYYEEEAKQKEQRALQHRNQLLE